MTNKYDMGLFKGKALFLQSIKDLLAILAQQPGCGALDPELLKKKT